MCKDNVFSAWTLCGISVFISLEKKDESLKQFYGFTPTLPDSQSSLVPGPSRLVLPFVDYITSHPILSYFLLWNVIQELSL